MQQKDGSEWVCATLGEVGEGGRTTAIRADHHKSSAKKKTQFLRNYHRDSYFKKHEKLAHGNKRKVCVSFIGGGVHFHIGQTRKEKKKILNCR